MYSFLFVQERVQRVTMRRVKRSCECGHAEQEVKQQVVLLRLLGCKSQLVYTPHNYGDYRHFITPYFLRKYGVRAQGYQQIFVPARRYPTFCKAKCVVIM